MRWRGRGWDGVDVVVVNAMMDGDENQIGCDMVCESEEIGEKSTIYKSLLRDEGKEAFSVTSFLMRQTET